MDSWKKSFVESPKCVKLQNYLTITSTTHCYHGCLKKNSMSYLGLTPKFINLICSLK